MFQGPDARNSAHGRSCVCTARQAVGGRRATSRRLGLLQAGYIRGRPSIPAGFVPAGFVLGPRQLACSSMRSSSHHVLLGLVSRIGCPRPHTHPPSFSPSRLPLPLPPFLARSLSHSFSDRYLSCMSCMVALFQKYATEQDTVRYELARVYRLLDEDGKAQTALATTTPVCTRCRDMLGYLAGDAGAHRRCDRAFFVHFQGYDFAWCNRP